MGNWGEVRMVAVDFKVTLEAGLGRPGVLGPAPGEVAAG